VAFPVTLIIGYGNLLIGLAYAALGLLSAWETFRLYRYRGVSRFGIGFALMAASCGPHHIAHGWHVLGGAPVSTPMLLATLVGLPAGLAFVALRVEAIRDGKGDRTFTYRPGWLVATGTAFAMIVGAATAWAVARPIVALPAGQALCTTGGLVGGLHNAGVDFTSPTFFGNLFVTVTYGMVGWYLGDTQVRRHVTGGTWSLSGLSLAGVFFSCAFMHLIHAFTVGAHSPTLWFDWLGIPASIYFLWVVRRVHSDSVVDWNRRPLVGIAVEPERASPWSGSSV
jgi:hypothetical protein